MGTPERSNAERASIRQGGGDLRRNNQLFPKGQRSIAKRVSSRARKLK